MEAVLKTRLGRTLRALAAAKEFAKLMLVLSHMGFSVGDYSWIEGEGFQLRLKSSDEKYLQFSAAALALVYPDVRSLPLHVVHILQPNSNAEVYPRSWGAACTFIGDATL